MVVVQGGVQATEGDEDREDEVIQEGEEVVQEADVDEAAGDREDVQEAGVDEAAGEVVQEDEDQLADVDEVDGDREVVQGGIAADKKMSEKKFLVFYCFLPPGVARQCLRCGCWCLWACTSGRGGCSTHMSSSLHHRVQTSCRHPCQKHLQCVKRSPCLRSAGLDKFR